MISNEFNDSDPTPVAGVARTWLLCVLVFSLFYALTCQHGVSWQDSGTFQWRVINADYTGQRGLALAHPLYIAAAQFLKCVPIGSLPGRLNFFSGLGMAVALANLAGVLTLLTRRRRIGLLIAAMLSVTHTVWWLSTIAEVYTWSAAGLTAELWLLAVLVRRPSGRILAAFAFVSGLGLSLHNLALLPLVVYFAVAVVFVARKKLSALSLVGAAGAWLAGAGVYLGFVIHQIVVTGEVWAAVQSALFGRYAAQVLNASSLSANFQANMALSALNFVSMLGPLAVVGWFGMRRRLGGTLAVALGAVTVIEALFFIRYPVPDQFTFILPTLVMVSLAAGVGLAMLMDGSRRAGVCAMVLCAVSIAAPPAFYAAAPGMLRSAGVQVSRGRNLPFRDEMRYWLVPWKQNENSARKFASEALGLVSSRDVILADSTSVYPLLVVRSENPEFEDVRVSEFNSLLPPYDDDPAAYRRALAGRFLYVVHPAQDGLSPGLLSDTNALGCPADSPVLYRLEWRRPPPIEP